VSLNHAGSAPDTRFDWLVLPVAGPFIVLPSSSNAGTAVLVADAAMQVIGMGLIVYGSAWRVPILVRDDMGSMHVAPAPFFTRTGGGLGVVGAF
jgi:hypothetical protein